MRLILTALFALALMGLVTVSSAASLETDRTAEMRGGVPGGEIHGGRGFAPGGEVHGGGRGIAPGGEIGERGEREEHREFRDGRHERHDRRFEGGDIYVEPGWGYYPYYEETPDSYGPPEEPGYLYYCDDPAGYYPNVVICNGEWETIPTDQEAE